ncbi:hypothetical protein CsSME_00046975 [Camellia sinensis var. sinensis]
MQAFGGSTRCSLGSCVAVVHLLIRVYLYKYCFICLEFDPKMNVIRMRRLGVRPENASNLVEQGRFGVENSKQPPNHLRAEYTLNLVERGHFGNENLKQPPNHRVDLTDSFPLTTRTCDNCRNAIRTCRLGVRPENALNLVERGCSGGENSKQSPNHRLDLMDSFPLTNRTSDN